MAVAHTGKLMKTAQGGPGGQQCLLIVHLSRNFGRALGTDAEGKKFLVLKGEKNRCVPINGP